MERFVVHACLVLALSVCHWPSVVRGAPVSADLAAKRALLLLSYHPTFVTSAEITGTVSRLLGAQGVSVDIEYMDSKRHAQMRWRQLFAGALGFKLAQRNAYDVVIVADDNALNFALEHHDALLAGAPLVFLAVNNLEHAFALDANPRVTGVVEKTSIAETIQLARRLDPALREMLAVVDDTNSGRADRAVFESLVNEIDDIHFTVLPLAEYTWKELGERFRRLQPGQAVLRLASYRDRQGEVLSADAAIRLISDNANVPLYELREHGLGSGATGGVVVSFSVQAEAAARLAVRILQGTPVGQMKVIRKSPNVAMVDARQLARFDVDPQQVPSGVRILNSVDRAPFNSVSVILAILVVVLSAMMCILVVKYLRSVRQTALNRDREEQFRILVEDSHQGVFIHRHSVPLFANRSYAEILGYGSPDEILALGNTARLYASHEHDRMRKYLDDREAGRPAPSQYNLEAVRKDGSVVVLHNVVHLTTWNGKPAIQHNVTDVTERVRAQKLLRESEERYRSLVENATEALVVLDVDAGRFVDANQNALSLFRTEREHFFGLDPVALSPPLQPDGRDSRELLEEKFAQTLAGERVEFEWTHRTVEGNDVPTEVRLVRLPSSSRRLIRGSIADVSERLVARQALEEKSAQLEATFENTDQGISMVNADLVMVAFNQRFLELLGFPVSQFSEGDTLEKFFRYNAERGEFGPGDVGVLVRRRLESVARFEAHRFIRTRPDGTVIEIRSQPLPGGGLVTTYSDITETHRLSEQLSHQARHDSLTGLLNRREFEARLGNALDVAREQGRAHAVCYLDLDQFKVINDTCGHMAGDELLRQLGTTLQAKVRKTDILARLGGDEFGVLLEDCPLLEAQRVAAALRAAVEDFRFSWEDKSFRLGVSIGLVPVTPDSGTAADVLSAADAACYTAKDQGRNRVHLFSDGDEMVADRQGEMRWVVRLQQALEEERLCLMCQPIVPLSADSTEGPHFEILIRMRDSDGALIAPGQFLPAAERYNMMGRVDRWVVGTALRTLAPVPGQPREPYVCSINLSGQSMGDDEFLEFIIEELRVTGVPAERIVFEVTETAAIANLSRAKHFMTTLKDIGCRFSLDDFGSGLSSFGYLKTLPVDYLKIDGMFVKDIMDDPIDLAMVRSINEIGHVMGKRTIAEFVENDAVRDRLQELGVDYAQGYGVGRPVLFPEAFPEVDEIRRAS